MSKIKYILAGIAFGFVATKSEIISWFRIQEMFRFQAFHMYGIIGTAIAVAMLSLFIIKTFQIKSLDGQAINIMPKTLHKGVLWGGMLFGFGWALTGACPGPLYAIIGNGFTVFIIPLASAVLGTYVYGLVRDKLPH